MLRILTVLCFASCDSVRDERILEFKELSVALTSLSKPEIRDNGYFNCIKSSPRWVGVTPPLMVVCQTEHGRGKLCEAKTCANERV